MSKKQEAASQEVKQDQPPERPICPYCNLPCKHNGKSFGVRYYTCDTEIGGCGKYTTKLGKPTAPVYTNEGLSARP